jgi:hypothetical protein
MAAGIGMAAARKIMRLCSPAFLPGKRNSHEQREENTDSDLHQQDVIQDLQASVQRELKAGRSSLREIPKLSINRWSKQEADHDQNRHESESGNADALVQLAPARGHQPRLGQQQQ